MEDERDSAHIPRSAGSDPSGLPSEFKLGAKLRARMEKLEKWRIRPDSIKSPEGAREFHGGNATVSKAFLSARIGYGWCWAKSYNSKEALQSCRQSPESDDHTRRAADHRRDDEGKIDELWWGNFVAVKKARMGDNKDPERVLGLALRETEILVELSHPNIAELEGFVEDISKDIIWLVFPWADNGNLKEFVALQNCGVLERISLLNDVASGLKYLHSQEPPICHGDLKSFNVLVNSDHVAVIIDFGSARRLTEQDLNRQPAVVVPNQQQLIQAKFSTLSKTITLTGNIYTLRWAAPELLTEDLMSLWSDIWAWGWIAYEVLTDSIPFQDVQTDTVVIESVIKGDLPSINKHADVAFFQNLCSLMTKCWNLNPRARPTAAACLNAISKMPKVNPGEIDTVSLNTDYETLMQEGRRERNSGDAALALVCFSAAGRIYTRIGDRPGQASALHCRAELHLVQKEYDKAIKLYSEVLKIHIDMGDGSGRASALWGLAEAYRLREDSSRATILYCEVLQICTDIGDRQGIVDALSSLAKVDPVRECSDTIGLDSETLQVRADIGNRQGRASALSGFAQEHQARREYREAIAFYSEALQIRPNIDDMQGKADALSGLAQEDQARMGYSEVIKLYSEALQIRPNAGDRQGKADALSGLAQEHQARKEYSKAIKLYSEALQIRLDTGDRRGEADALSDLARVHQAQEEYSEAIKLYSEALQISTDIGDKRGRAGALSGLARGHEGREEYSEAIKLCTEALQISTDIGDKRGRADALSGLARVHQARKEYRKAIKLYSEALKIHPSSRDKRGKADALFGLAQVHQARKEYTEAIELYEEVLQILPDDTFDDRFRGDDVEGRLSQLRRLRSG